MTDPLERLENELSQMRPRTLAYDLVERIGVAVKNDAPSPWPDRCLAAAMTAGALAACIIIAILIAQSASLAPSQSTLATAPQSPEILQYSQLLSRAGDEWSIGLK